MKVLVLLFFSIGALFANICDDKINELQAKIKNAETSKLSSMQEALNKLIEKCKNDKFTDALQAKISKFEANIDEQKIKIENARNHGNLLRIEQGQAKLKALQAELQAAKTQLLQYLEK